MADSNITKKALADSLKELMAEVPFSKISISDICSKCNMNRKSFYYHFKDKYDLVNWIYDTEFTAVAQKKNHGIGWDLMEDIFQILYDSRQFYRKALDIEGQNSFIDHFRDIIRDIVIDQMQGVFSENESYEFQIDFFTEAFVRAIHRWILEADPMTPDKMMYELKKCLFCVAEKYNEIKD